MDNLSIRGLSLTRRGPGRSFNQLTPSRGLPTSVRAAVLAEGNLAGGDSNTWRLNYEQENLPAEQPSSRQGARLPSSHAHPCGPRHPRCSPSQGSHRTLRVGPHGRQDLVLAHVNRITSGSDYQGVVRRGVRIVGAHTVLYVRPSAVPTDAVVPVRFGFIVAKNVGDAVRRNLVRRRLKAVTFELLSAVSPGTDVVIRALPSARDAAWQTLRDEVQRSLSRPLPARKGTGGR